MLRAGGNANYQAGETIECKVVITDPNDAGATYILKPEGNDQSKHQILNTDYVVNEYRNNVATISEQINISSTDQTSYRFSIKILRAGSFSLKFNLQKIVNNVKVGIPISENVLFFAVSFYAYSNYGSSYASGQRNCFGTLENSRWDREFFFSVYCGDQINDNYLFDPQFTYTYQTSYIGGGITGNLTRGDNMFYPSRFAGAGGDYCSIGSLNIIPGGYIINEIKVTQKSTNGSINNVIPYKNVSIVSERNIL